MDEETEAEPEAEADTEAEAEAADEDPDEDDTDEDDDEADSGDFGAEDADFAWAVTEAGRGTRRFVVVVAMAVVEAAAMAF